MSTPQIATAVTVVLVLLALFVQWTRMAGARGSCDRIEGVPLWELPAKQGGGRTLVVFLTSDAGWLGLNTALPRALAENGYSTVSWNSLRYYLTERSPEEAAADLGRVIETYTELWGKDEVALVGYSWGAGVLPFLANRLSPEQKSLVSSTTYLAYPGVAGFKFRPDAWLLRIGDDAVPARDEVAAMPRVPSVCIAGETDPIRDCRSIEEFGVERRLFPVGHSLTRIHSEILPSVLATLRKGHEKVQRERMRRGSDEFS